MKTHELKTWPLFFQAILDGKKRYEIRTADRDFAVGDWLRLCEYEPDVGYTGREAVVSVLWMSPPGSFGLPEGACIMSITSPDRPELDQEVCRLVSYAVTCRRNNTAEWMEGFCEHLNAMCKAIPGAPSVEQHHDTFVFKSHQGEDEE